MATERLDRSRLQIALLDGATALPAFTCGDEDLDGFLRDDALRLQRADVTRVYLAWYETELVGYAAVLTDAIQLRTNDVKRLKPLTYVDSKIIPAVKLGRLHQKLEGVTLQVQKRARQFRRRRHEPSPSLVV